MLKTAIMIAIDEKIIINFAFIGFLLAVISVVAALMVPILGNACFVISAASLAVVLLGSLWMAWAMVQEIV